MTLRRASFIAALLLPFAGPALAQFQPAGPNPFDRPPAANPFDNPPARAPANNPFDHPAQQQQSEPVCMPQFMKLRDRAEKLAEQVMAAQKKKVPLPEACKLLTEFSVSQEALLKFAKANQSSCGIPAQLIQQISLGHANVSKARTNVCRMAAAPQRPAGPSLSDALSAPIPDANNIKTGRGTFDTLTGTPLGAK